MIRAAPFSNRVRGRSDIRLYVAGDAWERARYWNDTSDDIGGLLCPDEHPERYRWDAVAGADVIVLQVASYPLAALKRLGELLIQAGANRVVIVYQWRGCAESCVFWRAVHGRAA